MYDFITGTLFMTVLSLSLSGALTGILITAIRPFTGKYFSKKWNYYIWLLVVVRLMIPLHFESGFPGLLHFHAEVSQNNDNTAQPADANMIQPNGNRTQSDGAVLPDNDRTQSDGMILSDIDLAQSDGMILPDNDLAQSDGITLPGDDLVQSGKANLSNGDSAQFGNMILSDDNQTQPDSITLSNGHSAHPDSMVLPAVSTANLLTAAALTWLGGAVLTLMIKLLQYCRFQGRLKKDCTRITD